MRAVLAIVRRLGVAERNQVSSESEDGLRVATGRRSAAGGGARVDRRPPGAERRRAGAGRLRRAAVAAAVGPRRRSDPPGADRRRGGAGRCASAGQPDRHRLGRTDDPLRRHEGAEGPVPVADPLGPGVLVPALLRAGQRQRSRQPRDASGARRRRVRRQRSEDLDQRCPVRQVRHPARPHRSGAAQAQGHLVLHLSDGRRRGSRSGRSPR